HEACHPAQVDACPSWEPSDLARLQAFAECVLALRAPKRVSFQATAPGSVEAGERFALCSTQTLRTCFGSSRVWTGPERIVCSGKGGRSPRRAPRDAGPALASGARNAFRARRYPF